MPGGGVRKRDGRVVPFEADKISRSLFAVTEALTRPDAFLARELADSVVHFLAAETEGKTPATEEVAETVAKVVRELGHPALAEAFVAYRHLCSDASRSTLHAFARVRDRGSLRGGCTSCRGAERLCSTVHVANGVCSGPGGCSGGRSR